MDNDQIRAERLAVLKDKLAARKDKPGFKANVEAIEKQIYDLENPPEAFRDTESGEFVSLEHAIQNPETTERAEFADE